MAKTYFFAIGTGNPSAYTALSPTFIIFSSTSSSLTPPGITEYPTGSGFYYFNYGATQSVCFLIDMGSGVDSSVRYVKSALDPVQAVDQQIGTTADSIGTTGTDPSTMLGYLKRALEFNEGNSVYDKSAGTWTLYARGSSTAFQIKTISNSTSSVTKT